MIKPRIIFTPDYVIKVKTKEESLEFLKARLAQLRGEGKGKCRECRFIEAILRHQECET